MGLKTQEKNGLLLMPTAKVTKNVSAATGGGNVLCSTLISIKTKAWLYSFRYFIDGSMFPSFHIAWLVRTSHYKGTTISNKGKRTAIQIYYF